jgi:hypothetical protein
MMARIVWEYLLRTSRSPYLNPQRKNRDITRLRRKLRALPLRNPEVGAMIGTPPVIFERYLR